MENNSEIKQVAVNDIPLVPVNSSNILAIGYDEPTERMVVMFPRGAAYVYHPVKKEVHQQIMTASSKGAAFDSLIKYNKSISFKKI